jgi:hypothetical protein
MPRAAATNFTRRSDYTIIFAQIDACGRGWRMSVSTLLMFID